MPGGRTFGSARPASRIPVNVPPLTAADGTPLRRKLRQAERMRRVRAFGLVVPLLAFVLASFVAPIALMLFRSIDNPVVADNLPETLAALGDWSGAGLPDEGVYTLLAGELKAARKARTIGRLATRLNYEVSGLRSVITKSARRLGRVKSGPYRAALIGIDRKWGEVATWNAIKVAGARITAGYYLNALDLRLGTDGAIEAQPEERRIYVALFLRTLWISLLITGFCLLLGYPIAFLMASAPTRIANLLLILVLLPFWTSLLVRTTAWIVVLQTNGVLNDTLVFLGLMDDAGRVQMIYNMIGTVVAMIHILLPFMVLPIYSVMKTIPPSYMRAARSLGATPTTAFVRVYLPQTVPGIGAGAILVFILAIGYYITPALVGGRTGQLISNFIAYHMQSSLNWGLAAALGGLLLAGVMALYLLYNRVVGIDNMKLG